MNIDIYITPIIFILTIIGLITFQKRSTLIFGLTLLSLIITSQVNRDQLLSSITNPGLVTLILLILCSLSIEKTRVLRALAAKIIVKKYQSTQIRLFAVTVSLSAILNNTAVVATLLSSIRNNPHHLPSKLLLPLSYSAILGGTLTLIGTSTNLIVNSLYIDASGESLNFFSFTAVGGILVIVCGFVMSYSSKWLPEFESVTNPNKDYFIEAKIVEGSELIGLSVEANGLRHLESLFLAQIIRNNHLISPVSPEEILALDDRLLFAGDINKLMQLSQFSGLKTFAHHQGLSSSELTEVIVRQESLLVGKTLKAIGFRALFDAAVVAIKRDGKQISGKLGEIKIMAGDFLILAIGKQFIKQPICNKNFIFISDVEPEVHLAGWQSWLSLGGFFGLVILAALGFIDLLLAMVVFLGLLILSRSISVNELIRRFPFDIWLVVSSAILLSHALTNAGVVELIGRWINLIANKEDAYWGLILVYLFTWLLTELITNNAAAAIMFPIAYSIALGLGVNVLPFVMIVAFAASGSFISPYGYQTNLMVFNAGQYNIKDFIRVGLPVSIAYAIVVICFVPIFFHF